MTPNCFWVNNFSFFRILSKYFSRVYNFNGILARHASVCSHLQADLIGAGHLIHLRVSPKMSPSNYHLIMKTRILLLLIVTVLTATGCSGRQEPTRESATYSDTVRKNIPEYSRLSQPEEEPIKYLVPERTPRPVFRLADFSVSAPQPAHVNWFDFEQWPTVSKNTWLEPGRLGNIPTNLLREGKMAFDEDFI